MRSFIILVLLFTHAFGGFGQSPKRGMAYGYHSAADLNVESQGISWWYNWAYNPDAGVVNVYKQYGVEYVPMIWGGTFNVNNAIANIPDGAKYLLAFNEPNFGAESNLTPAQAASLWPQLEQIADARNLQIVGPAVNYCGGSCNEQDAIKWLDDFFAACPTCRVDYIAFHTYECTTGALTWNLNNYKKYGRPIWLTEFACWNTSSSSADMITFMNAAVTILEADPDVYRYSWFTGRREDNPTINVLGNSGVLTSLGSAYINKSYGPISSIPGKVEAENHYRRRGINKEATTDAGGGENIGWFDPWDWGEYLVNISQEGYYNFQFRVASLNQVGKFHLALDDTAITSTISFNPTGGYQNWITITVNNVPLKSGQHLLKFISESYGFNVNYFTATYAGPITGLFGKDEKEGNIEIYPNPFMEEFTVSLKEYAAVKEIQLMDVSGKIVKVIDSNLTTSTIVLDQSIPSGVYIVRIITDDAVYSKMVMKKQK